MKPFYTAKNYAMRNSVGYLMRVCTNRLLPQMEALFEDQELTFSQWTTLVALHDGRITTAGDLAHNICHDADTDRRVVTLALTEPGRRLVEAQAPKVMEFWNGMLSGFSHAEVETLIALLTRLVIATEAKTGKKLLISDAPIMRAKPQTSAKAKKSS